MHYLSLISWLEWECGSISNNLLIVVVAVPSFVKLSSKVVQFLLAATPDRLHFLFPTLALCLQFLLLF